MVVLVTRSGRNIKKPVLFQPTEEVLEDDYCAEEHDTDNDIDSDIDTDDELYDESEDDGDEGEEEDA